ncbi:Metallo-dependent phosphatase-like protein [Naematelia encephala]|uniref:Endopolyphosphatase n=1 Tax=Naematelia encephala TaxID=71784 RepID=A0A1Y2BJK8_9TREE|nr:Metallo-dependent phosphatase-like protein [Naematelia encephala]
MRSFTVLGILAFALRVAGEQAPLLAASSAARPSPKPLKGRFLHITDFHPDSLYVAGSTFESGCHRKLKKDKGKSNVLDDGAFGEEDGVRKKAPPAAGRWGTGLSDCDSPISLVNATFDWLKKEWADEVDFVVWTGDNARHDIDRETPRTPSEIFESNRMMAAKMSATFGKDVVIVPSIGNNDIYPHNVLAPGPNRITSGFLKIWKHFIPTDFLHVFERGAYFPVEVIPDRLAVISLNTLFWYDANTLVDGCRDHTTDPGSLELEWLEVQLNGFRDRGMQVWLTGHVPPHIGLYFENCYLRYGDIALRFQDTIVGHLYGHMNVDHFFFIDVQELEDAARLASTSPFTSLSNVSTGFAGPDLRHGSHLTNSGRLRTFGRSGNKGLSDALKKDFGEMPGPTKLKLKDYAVMNVAPSVIPTYLPGVRVYTYNITGVTRDLLETDLDSMKRKHGHRHDKPKDDCSKPANEDKPHCTFKHKPRHYDRNSPSRHNQPLTPLGYTQFYMPDIDSQSKSPPKWVIEYTTFKIPALLPKTLDSNDTIEQPPPVPLHLLPEYQPDILVDEEEGSVDPEKKKKFKKALRRITPWKMKDLTINSYVKLARKLVAEKKMWSKFQDLMYVSSDLK